MTMSRTRLVMGNWKMHGNLADNAKLLAGLRAGAASAAVGTQLAVCVPFPYLAQAGEALKGTAVAWAHKISVRSSRVRSPAKSLAQCLKILPVDMPWWVTLKDALCTPSLINW